VAKKYIVTLTAEERGMLEEMTRTGKAAARKIAHARILLKADVAEGGPGWPDEQIAGALDVSASTVRRIRLLFVEEGLDVALNPRPAQRAYPTTLDGAGEAHLIALTCGVPPEGRARWSLRLLADRFVALGYGEAVSHETVRQTLKKNELRPWLKDCWCIPPQASGAFVAQMEEVLDVYMLPEDPDYPLVCMDEASKQLIGETRAPLPARPGAVAHEDYEYVRQGVANLFMFFAPLLGWRHVTVTERRTRLDWAYAVRDLVDVHFPAATKIRLVSDNLNTHDPGSLYEAFPPEEARRILDRLALHHTPTHGSWLNMAEIELSVRGRQCLDRRIPDHDTLAREVAAWEAPRNGRAATMEWRFTTADARSKLTHLYPVTTLLAHDQVPAPADRDQFATQVA